MRPTPEQLLKWELTRERFRIEDRAPPPERRNERSLRDILAGILQTNMSVTEPLPQKITDRWPVAAGEQLAKHTRPVFLKDAILYVYADHPGWLAELRRLPKAHLLKKISVIPGIPEIKEIRFQLDPAIRTVRK